jgi:hypothetical protein
MKMSEVEAILGCPPGYYCHVPDRVSYRAVEIVGKEMFNAANVRVVDGEVYYPTRIDLVSYNWDGPTHAIGVVMKDGKVVAKRLMRFQGPLRYDELSWR